ncbi:MAG: histidine phosphatase family protein [Anaerolineaceae bacterium]
MPTYFFVRHGLNDFTGRKLIGRLPGIHLNDVGRKQAQAVAEYLREKEITFIFSSPLERASETAEPLSTLKNLPVEYTEALSEVDFGRLQGKTSKQLKKMKIWDTVHTTPSRVQFPEGETLVHAQQRVVGFIEETSTQFGEKDLIACFTHSDIVRLMLAHYLCIQLDDFHRLTVDTGSISTLQHHSDNIRILNVNQAVP